MRHILTMAAGDLLQRLRDRSVLIFGIAVPLGLMAVFNLVLGGTEELELEPVTLAVAAPAGDELAPVLGETLARIDALDVTLTEVGAEQARALAADGTADLAMIVPDGFGDAVRAGEPVTVEMVEGDGAGVETDVLLAVAQGVLDQLAAGTEAAAAASAAGLPPDTVGEVAARAATDTGALTLEEGVASSEQLSTSATLVAGQAGLFLLFTVGFGVLGLVAEREQGTMARLRSMPMRPGTVVAAKALVSFVLGVVATTVLLVAGSLMFGADFGSPLAVGVLVLCAVAAATSLMFVVARLARTAEQASVMQSILAMGLGVAGGAFFPLAASGLLARVLDLNPVAALMRGLGITAGGGGLGDIGVPVLTMLGFAAVAVAVSRLVPDRAAAP
jgi:ABC-2 type transport system permease protein